MKLEDVEISTWKKTGRFGAQQIVFVAYVETHHIETQELTGKFLLIYSARK